MSTVGGLRTHYADPPRAAPSPRVPWGEFLAWFAGEWEQGEHITLIGTTGSGKTTTVMQFLGLRSHVVAFGVKGRDETMEKLIRSGYFRIKRWAGEVDAYLVLWPEVKSVSNVEGQREVFREAFDHIFRAGGWAVFLDEVSYLSDMLGMERELKMMVNQGRSSGISIIAATQRPAFIPLAFYDQASHLFMWRDNDKRNIRRLAELTGDAASQVATEIANLERREVLYLQKDTGFRVRTKVEI